jgi:hypothetical protein
MQEVTGSNPLSSTHFFVHSFELKRDYQVTTAPDSGVGAYPDEGCRTRCPGTGRQRIAAEVSQATLKSFDEVEIYGWLSFGVAARWLCPGLLRLVDAER